MTTETEVVVEDGVAYTLERVIEPTTLGRQVTRLVVSADIAKLRWLAQEPSFLLDEEYVRWQAMDGDEVVFTDYSLYWLKKAISSYFRQQTRQERLRYCKEVADELASKLRQLRINGRPVRRLEELIQLAQIDLEKIKWNPRCTFAEVMAALNAAKNQLERVENSTMEVLVQELTDGQNGYEIHSANQQVLLQTAELEIRSGGVIVATSTDWLTQEWYPLVLDGVKTVPGMLGCSDLRVTLDSLVSQEERQNSEIEWAPETLGFTDRTGNVTPRDVVYGYQQVGDRRIAAGVVTVKLSDYQRLGSIPKLPHKIKLFFSLTVEGEVVLTGEAGAELDAKIARRKKGARRGEAGAPLRDRAIEATVPPPWFAGRAR